jgi:hypothetical protein
MIFTPEYPQLPNRFPADKCTIITRVRLKDVVGECPPEKLDTLPEEIRHLVHHKKSDAKKRRDTTFKLKPEKYNPTIPTCLIFIRDFHGIKLQAVKDPNLGWVITMITFNPGSVCHGHNGWILEDEHFVHACSDLIELVAPLLEDRDDSIHLIPGLHSESRAYWKSLEIPFQTLDPDGLILRAFDNAKHPEINVPPLYKCRNESIAFGNTTSDLAIRIYRKDLELRKKLRKVHAKPTSDLPVLRIEVQLSDAKLEKHFKGGVWKMIEGVRRLVSFRASDMQAAFLSVMSSFSGVYSRPPSLAAQNDDKIGRMMGWVAATTGILVEDQIAYYTHRFLAKSTKASVRNARSTLRKAARKELALQSTVNLSDLFSSDAWHYQPAVTCMELEAMREGHHMNVINHPLVEAAYATRGYAIHPSYGSRAPRPAAAISDTTRVITQTNEIC